MTTHTIGNHLGCVIKYLKKKFDQCYDVIMTSSIGQFLKNNFLKPTLFETHFIPRTRKNKRNLRPHLRKIIVKAFRKSPETWYYLVATLYNHVISIALFSKFIPKKHVFYAEGPACHVSGGFFFFYTVLGYT